MTIRILPAQLANQIAAGEVVERPASVVKELIENSLDAGASQIKIEIEKGGAKRICITDNGVGIIKAELALALSRHATSKISDLDDLEGIASLGFRGEALASISSVSRLTLTSKPTQQANAWQAMAQGRDMQVTVQPAAHPNGTSIEILDLFFNTPARRKFLRTEKTEFAHIEEVVRRIALARFDVAFTLSHNDKVVKQYRQLSTPAHYSKRVAQICGAKFIDHAVAINCQHDGLQLTGWVAKPSFYRSQNDLCYSYVNGRMMRDKLINHAIRQAFAELLPDEGYPAFVLFLSLDVREVDVNVHPAKHEVRFHQGRYVHDFIYSVVNDALKGAAPLAALINSNSEHNAPSVAPPSYISALKPIAEPELRSQSDGAAKLATTCSANQIAEAAAHYQQLMTPLATQASTIATQANGDHERMKYVTFIAPHFVLYQIGRQLRGVSIKTLASEITKQRIVMAWPTGLVSQPLLLPVLINLSEPQMACWQRHQQKFEQAGIFGQLTKTDKLQIRQFPALLRAQDVSATLSCALAQLLELEQAGMVLDQHWCQLLANLASLERIDEKIAQTLFQQASTVLKQHLTEYLALNSIELDLRSQLQQLT